MNHVLRPLSKKELDNLFDKRSRELMEYFIKKSLFSQPETRIGQPKLPIQIPKEHIEQWLVQALEIKWIGAWSYAIDVINKKIDGEQM